MIATKPLTIDDRVQHDKVAVLVRIEHDQVDEFMQELNSIIFQLHGEVLYNHTDPLPAKEAPRD